MLKSPDNVHDFSLEYGKFRFLLKSTGKAVLPYFKGSALRGVLGKAFRKIACHSRQKSCEGCMFLTRCAYAYIFETNWHNIPEKIGQHYVPRPYVIEPFLDGRESYNPGDSLLFNLVLFGHGLDYLPFFILAFQEVCELGLGARRYPFTLESVEQDVGGSLKTIWRGGKNLLQSPERENLSRCLELEAGANGGELKLELETPMRLVFEGQMVSTLVFPPLIRALFRRIGFLARAHGEISLELPFQEMLRQSENIQVVESALSWQEWERYSTRQHKKIQMGGLVGAVSFKGKLREFRPFLRMGEIVHVGKGTVFGLGKMRIVDNIGKSP